jgi:RNA-directed DNA polymerase
MTDEDQPAEVPARDRQAGEDLWQRYGAERGVWSENMLRALERGVKGTKWFSLIDKVYADRTLGLAWAKVKSNAGACGVDGITVERFDKDSQKRLLAVKEHLKRGAYQPKPVKRVEIDKPGSSRKRPLGIPTVRDRVVQTALKMAVEPIFEREFAPSSYGFRPGRGCKDALRHVDRLLKGGKLHVVDADIASYFDSINHERLLALVGDRIADGRVMELVEKLLKQGILEGMAEWEPEEGTPQGGVMSPLLANIYLNAFDWEMGRKGFEIVRYADDFVVLCDGAEEARRALEEIREWMNGAQLALHPEKTRVEDMRVPGAYFDFLGYRFKRTKGAGRLGRFARPKSTRKLRGALKPFTKRTSGQSMDVLVARLNPKLRGWYQYFRQADAASLEEMDRWVRQRLRAILKKRQKRRGRAKGRDFHRWPNHYFATLGLLCLKDAQAEELSLRRGATR